MKRRRFSNDVSQEHLRRVRLLFDCVPDGGTPASTHSLLGCSGLKPKTGLGALKMAEVLGLVHSTHGPRKGLIWRAGQAPRAPGTVVNWLPYRRMRDLLQYYRGSLIGTPDLMRDSGIADDREALGALKALAVLGHVEFGHIDSQTIGWQWISGLGQTRTYQRGAFPEIQLVPMEAGPAGQTEDDFETGQAMPQKSWIDLLVHNEWRAQEQEDAFGAIAQNDQRVRFRAETPEAHLFGQLVVSTIAAMPTLQRVALALTLLRGLTESEVADLVSVSRATVGRQVRDGLTILRQALTECGYGPSAATDDLAEVA